MAQYTGTRIVSLVSPLTIGNKTASLAEVTGTFDDSTFPHTVLTASMVTILWGITPAAALAELAIEQAALNTRLSDVLATQALLESY